MYITFKIVDSHRLRPNYKNIYRIWRVTFQKR